MKLIYKVTRRLALVVLPVLLLWATVFYFAMVNEVNDETDDSLEDYAEMIARRVVTGEELPTPGDGSNNTYSIELLPASGGYRDSKAYEDREVYIYWKKETEPARVLTKIFHDDYGAAYKLVVSIPTFERDDIIKAILFYLAILYAVLVFTILIVTVLVFRYSMKPLYSLLKWLDGYRPGNGTAGFPDEESVLEFKKLTKAARETIERAENHLERQKQFIGNASHELQTPLAVLGNRIEWMMDSTSLSEEQFAELSKMRQSIHRLVRLNRTLLLLSKIDSGHFLDKSDVDIVSIIENELELYKEIFAEKEICCNVNVPSGYVVQMDEMLATTMVSNIIKNAFVHSPVGGTIDVCISHDELIVSNNGDEALDKARLFDRFYTSGKTGSTGLGLALVKSIACYYDYGLEYAFDGHGHSFMIRFKR
ncbi:MAG: HAMP domain-containing histidine kinase [Bacteroidaceae bacterium]|nr:HAMP domain-containing histidine kinase [Bacteroidaceae bacterium]